VLLSVRVQEKIPVSKKNLLTSWISTTPLIKRSDAGCQISRIVIWLINLELHLSKQKHKRCNYKGSGEQSSAKNVLGGSGNTSVPGGKMQCYAIFQFFQFKNNLSKVVSRVWFKQNLLLLTRSEKYFYFHQNRMCAYWILVVWWPSTAVSEIFERRRLYNI